MIIQNPVFPKSAVETTTILATGKNVAEGGEGCRRCHGLVYDAEKMAMRSGAYHKMCFTCALCRRALDYLLAVDSPGQWLPTGMPQYFDTVISRSMFYIQLFTPCNSNLISQYFWKHWTSFFPVRKQRCLLPLLLSKAVWTNRDSCLEARPGEQGLGHVHHKTDKSGTRLSQVQGGCISRWNGKPMFFYGMLWISLTWLVFHKQ